jgi:uncharacterized lipoprotein YddW (UPF0748 family)
MLSRRLTLLALLVTSRSAAAQPAATAATLGEAPPPVPREFRAVWVSPVGGLGASDWPSRPGLSADAQRAELRALFDRARAIGLNAVVMHVRTAADAFYPTPLAPWTAFISGRSGVGPSPAYDPLAFAVEEAHARGLQLHAWFNPFRAMLPNFKNAAAPNHVTRLHPSWIRKYGTQTWIDPGEPAAREMVLEAMVDVVRRYDVDGIHIDDYFYPYRESERIVKRVRGKRRVTVRDIAFPDDATWKKYGVAKGWKDRGDWRRANVNDFIEQMYVRVKAANPTTLVGISPFGIWRSGTPAGITGLDAYHEIYADSRKWLVEGWLDYVVPQLYWELDGKQSRFVVLDRWWRAQNPLGRHIWAGLGTSNITSRRDAWSLDEIPLQIARLREWRAGTTDAPGHVHFRMGVLRLGSTLLGEKLHETAYAEPALVPAFPWLGGNPPASPRVTAMAGMRVAVSVAPGDSMRVAWWLVQTRNRDGQWTTAVHPGSLTWIAVEGDPDRVAVTAIDRAGLASAPVIVRW